MQVSEIDEKKYGSKFPDSQKIVAGDKVDCKSWKTFTTDDGFEGVSLQDASGKLYFSTAKSVVGFVKSEKTNLNGLIKRSKEGAVTIFFKNVKPTNSTRTSMLNASFYP